MTAPITRVHLLVANPDENKTMQDLPPGERASIRRQINEIGARHDVPAANHRYTHGQLCIQVSQGEGIDLSELPLTWARAVNKRCPDVQLSKIEVRAESEPGAPKFKRFVFGASSQKWRPWKQSKSSPQQEGARFKPSWRGPENQPLVLK